MQTFLPFADFPSASAVLDDSRLGKQRVETFQILRALTWPTYGWKNHPVTRMWRGFVPALVAYGLANCAEWSRRGYADTVRDSLLAFTGGVEVDVDELERTGQLPPWLGLDVLHVSHQSALVRKDPARYRELFPDVADDLPYWWPPPVFPRWPVRSDGTTGSLEGALAALGYPTALPGQAESALAAAAQRDCLAVIRPGRGGSTAGLLAGLVTPGTTWWVSPDDRRRGTYARSVIEPAEPLRSPGPRQRAAPVDALARRPGPEERAAMAAAAAPPQWRFFRASQLLARPSIQEPPGLVVVDGAARLSARELAAISGARRQAGSPPVLALVGRADGERRTELAAQLHLTDPVHVGGGWDPEAFLDVEAPSTSAAHRSAVLATTPAHRPAVILTESGAASRRLVAALGRRGLRAGAAEGGARSARSSRVGAAWRARRLDALVVSGVPDRALLGRLRPAAVLAADPPASPETWIEVLDGLQPASAVLLAGPDAPGWARAWVSSPGCLRASLLALFGQPVPEPCGRCSRDLTAGAEAPSP